MLLLVIIPDSGVGLAGTVETGFKICCNDIPSARKGNHEKTNYFQRFLGLKLVGIR